MKIDIGVRESFLVEIKDKSFSSFIKGLNYKLNAKITKWIKRFTLWNKLCYKVAEDV